jgi:hypothetical protein
VEHWKSYLTKKYSMTFILRKLYFMVGDENKSKLNILIKKTLSKYKFNTII